jgi:hypothetical protein
MTTICQKSPQESSCLVIDEKIILCKDKAHKFGVPMHETEKKSKEKSGDGVTSFVKYKECIDKKCQFLYGKKTVLKSMLEEK